jgi:hypothetical protein
MATAACLALSQESELADETGVTRHHRHHRRHPTSPASPASPASGTSLIPVAGQAPQSILREQGICTNWSIHVTRNPTCMTSGAFRLGDGNARSASKGS